MTCCWRCCPTKPLKLMCSALWTNFLVLPSCRMRSLPSPTSSPSPTMKKAAKDNPPGMGGNVDEPTTAGRQIRFGTQFGDIHTAIGVHLQERQQRHIEAAPLEVGELLGRCH